MAYVIADLGMLSKVAHKTQILSCMKQTKEQLKNKIHNPEKIQKRIEKVAEVRAKLEAETAKRNEEIKKINFLG